MLDVIGLRGIGDVLALLLFGFAAHELPKVGDGEDGVSILEGGSKGVQSTVLRSACGANQTHGSSVAGRSKVDKIAKQVRRGSLTQKEVLTATKSTGSSSGLRSSSRWDHGTSHEA